MQQSFYTLYDKIYRKDVLAEAWRRSPANGGEPGSMDSSFAPPNNEARRRHSKKLRL